MATKGLRIDQSDYDSQGAPSIALTTLRNLGATQKGVNEYEVMENEVSKVNLQQVIRSEADDLQVTSFLDNGKRAKRNCKVFLQAFLAVLIVVVIIGLVALVGVNMYISQRQYNTALKIRNEDLEKNLEARLNTTIFALDGTSMTQLSGLLSLVDNLQSLVDNLNVTTMTQLNSLQTSVDTLNDTTQNQLSTVSSLQTSVDTLNNTSQDKQSGLRTAIDTLSDSTQNQVSSLQTTIKTLNNMTQRQLGSLQTSVEALNDTTQNQLSNLQTTIDTLDINVRGTVYTRWGNSSCPNSHNELYSGRVGGTPFFHRGGASNLLCLPQTNIQYSASRSGIQGSSYMFGAEYENPLRSGGSQDNVPCAVCSAPSQYESLMIPARLNCPTGWTAAYSGYLMSESRSNYRSSFICVDSSQEGISGTAGHGSATDLFHVEADCNSMLCSPLGGYDSTSELTCVVCTR